MVPLSDSGAYARTSDRTGFTLVEVMLAMVVLSVATLGIVQLAGVAMLASRDSLCATTIAVAAENTLEAARDRGFAGNTPGVATDTLLLRGVRYARRITVVDASTRTREIRVDMSRVGSAPLTFSTLAYISR